MSDTRSKLEVGSFGKQNMNWETWKSFFFFFPKGLLLLVQLREEEKRCKASVKGRLLNSNVKLFRRIDA